MADPQGLTGERKYRVIAGDLRAAIGRGEYPADSRLPGENDLMRQYQVARMTARQALAQLINEGLAVARKGSGVYVRDFRPVVRAGADRLSARGWGSGRSIWSADAGSRELSVDQLEVRRAAPPAHIRLLLDLTDDPDAQVVVRSRRYVLDGKPVLLSVSYLPGGLAVGTMMEYQDAGPGGVYARLRELGHAPARFREDLRARMPEPGEATALGLPPGTPVVDIVRTAYGADRQVVEVSEMIADASSYVFRYDFDA
ncbi:MAG TPA: GntR family transcriptional regulator [Streptosporangiaceae bacterium]|nr:GntR family transcriptional regulator [Streptosporangiaceae bacterium]